MKMVKHGIDAYVGKWDLLTWYKCISSPIALGFPRNGMVREKLCGDGDGPVNDANVYHTFWLLALGNL